MVETYIFGNNDFATMIAAYLIDSNIEFNGFICDKKYKKSESLFGYPLIAWEDFILNPPECSFEILNAVGYGHMNAGRKKVYDKIKSAGFRLGGFIHPKAVVSKNAILGEGNIVLDGVCIEPFFRCGDCNIFMSGGCYSHHSLIGSFNFFAAHVVILGKVEVGDFCFVGSNATIKNRSKIASKTLIGANAFCSFDTIENSVIVPNKSIVIDKKADELL